VPAKAFPRPMTEVAEAFLLQKQVTGCSSRTVAVYKFWLDRLVAAVPDLSERSAHRTRAP